MDASNHSGRSHKTERSKSTSGSTLRKTLKSSTRSSTSQLRSTVAKMSKSEKKSLMKSFTPSFRSTPKKSEEKPCSSRSTRSRRSSCSPVPSSSRLSEKSSRMHTSEYDNKKSDKHKRSTYLEKYWRAVRDDPRDFTAWTYLLQYVEDENNIEVARSAYDRFLDEFPLCYGYWRKYAEYERRKGLPNKVVAIYERSLECIPLSVDLWMHYLSYTKSVSTEKYIDVCKLFERAIEKCGLEFRSDCLWIAYINWEIEHKQYRRAIHTYDRFLAVPTHESKSKLDNFQSFIKEAPLTETITSEELRAMRTELREDGVVPLSSPELNSRHLWASTPQSPSLDSSSTESEDTEQTRSGDDGNKSGDAAETSAEGNTTKEYNELDDSSTLCEPEISLVKDKIITARQKMHKQIEAEVRKRWHYEESIRRTYFHIKPLDRKQLANWSDYLDFEVAEGSRRRILILFERCLIACADYVKFWIKFVRYLESFLDEPDIVTLTAEAFRRACTIHHRDKPNLHLMWAAFEESHKNHDKAVKILVNIEKKFPDMLLIAFRRINIERRKGNHEKCQELYQEYICNAKNVENAGIFATKYARYLHKFRDDIDGALSVLRQAWDKNQSNTTLVLYMIDMALQRKQVDEDEVVLIIDKFMGRESVALDDSILFARRKVEFLEDFGTSPKTLQEAQRLLTQLQSKADEQKEVCEVRPRPKGKYLKYNTDANITATRDSPRESMLQTSAISQISRTFPPDFNATKNNVVPNNSLTSLFEQSTSSFNNSGPYSEKSNDRNRVIFGNKTSFNSSISSVYGGDHSYAKDNSNYSTTGKINYSNYGEPNNYGRGGSYAGATNYGNTNNYGNATNYGNANNYSYSSGYGNSGGYNYNDNMAYNGSAPDNFYDRQYREPYRPNPYGSGFYPPSIYDSGSASKFKTHPSTPPPPPGTESFRAGYNSPPWNQYRSYY